MDKIKAVYAGRNRVVSFCVFAFVITLFLLPRAEGKEHVRLYKKDSAVYANSPDMDEVRFQSLATRKVIRWAMENWPITILEDGTFTVGNRVNIPRSGVSLIIGKNAALRMEGNGKSNYVTERHGKYYPLIYNDRRDDVNVINFGTLHAGRGVCILYDGRNSRRTRCGVNGGMIFSSGKLIGAQNGVTLVDCKETKVPYVCTQEYGNAALLMEGCEHTRINLIAGLAGAGANENEIIDLNAYNEDTSIGTVIGQSPSEELIDVNTSVNTHIDTVKFFGNPEQTPTKASGTFVNIRPTPAYARRLTIKPYIDHCRGTVINGEEIPVDESTGFGPRRLKDGLIEVVNKSVKSWKRNEIAPDLPEALPRFSVETTLVARFENGSRETVYNRTVQLDLSGSGD